MNVTIPINIIELVYEIASLSDELSLKFISMISDKKESLEFDSRLARLALGLVYDEFDPVEQGRLDKIIEDLKDIG